MLRRAVALFLAVGLLVMTAATASAAGFGACSTHDHWIVDNQGWDPGLRGVQATIDATSAQSLCSGAVTPDNGVLHTVMVSSNQADQADGGQIAIGIVMCDPPTVIVAFCHGNHNPRFAVNNVSCYFGHSDIQIDLGAADWAPHQYRVWFDGARYWYAYIDGVVAHNPSDGSLMKFDITTGTYGCMNPLTVPGVTPSYGSERWDLGDGFGDGGPNYVLFSGMQFRNNSSWVGDYRGVGYDCDHNNRAYPASHYQVCYWPSSNSYRANTVY